MHKNICWLSWPSHGHGLAATARAADLRRREPAPSTRSFREVTNSRDGRTIVRAHNRATDVAHIGLPGAALEKIGEITNE